MKNKLADSQSSSTSYLANSGPFTARAPSQNQHHGHNSRYPGPALSNNFTTAKQTNRVQQQRYLPNIENEEDDNLPSIKNARRPFPDPSEPIYTDPSLFERSRSITSMSLKDQTRPTREHESVKLQRIWDKSANRTAKVNNIPNQVTYSVMNNVQTKSTRTTMENDNQMGKFGNLTWTQFKTW